MAQLTKESEADDVQRKVLKEFRGLADAMPNEQASWKHRATTADGIKIYMMKVAGDPLYTFGGMAECDFPVDAALSLSSIDVFKALDPMIQKVVEFEHPETDERYVWSQVKVGFGLWDRDFVTKGVNILCDDGAFVNGGYSVQLDHVFPEQPDKYVRGEVRCAYIIKPLPNGRCHVTYISRADPKGWVPSMAVNFVAKDQAKNVRRFRDYFTDPKNRHKPQ